MTLEILMGVPLLCLLMPMQYLYIAPKTLPPAQGEPVKPGGSGEAGQPGQTEESTPEEAKG